MKSMDLQARYSDSHPLVQAIKQQVEEAQKIVDARSEHETETTEDVNPIHRDLSLELKQQQNIVAGYQSRLAELEKQKGLVQADLRTTNQCEVTLDQLERQTELARSKYFQYSHNLEDSRISTELENERISNVSIAQAATLAENPVSPPKPLVIIATLVLATAGTAALVFVSENLNDRLRTEGEVEEALGVPVLATIPDGRHARRVFHTNGSNGNGRMPGRRPARAFENCCESWPRTSTSHEHKSPSRTQSSQQRSSIALGKPCGERRSYANSDCECRNDGLPTGRGRTF